MLTQPHPNLIPTYMSLISLHSKLRCLESCPVLNRSDNRELYFHMDTIKPLQLEADNSLSRSQLYVPPTIAQNIKDLHSSVRYFSMKFVYFRAVSIAKSKKKVLDNFYPLLE